MRFTNVSTAAVPASPLSAHRRAARLMAAFVLACAACGSGHAGTAGPGGDNGGDAYVPPEFDAAVVSTADRLSSAGNPATVLAAMALAGFDQVNENGAAIVPPATPRQGITFEQGDAAIIAAAMQQGPALSVDDLVGGWAAMGMIGATDDALKAKTDAMRAALVADLRKAAVSTCSTWPFPATRSSIRCRRRSSPTATRQSSGLRRGLRQANRSEWPTDRCSPRPRRRGRAP